MSQKIETITVTIKEVDRFHAVIGQSKTWGVLFEEKLPDGFKPEWMFRTGKTPNGK